MQSNKQERDISQALGSVPKVNTQRAFSCTITIAGTGLADILVRDIISAIQSQHELINGLDEGFGLPYDQLYVHKCRAFGSAGGFLSIAPYAHRYNLVPAGDGATDQKSNLWNSYGVLNQSGQVDTFRRGSLTQMYEVS